MSEIQVVFNTASGNPPPVGTSVSNPTLIANKGDTIAWQFYCCDKKIQFAEIEFQNSAYQFFKQGYNSSDAKDPAKKQPHRFMKNLKNSRSIYGIVPPIVAEDPVPAKYTVRGLDAGQNVVCELDPVIVVNEP